METKTCSKCHAEFGCGSQTSGCWCQTLHIDVETLKSLSARFNGCLCPVCLAEYAKDADAADDSDDFETA